MKLEALQVQFECLSERINTTGLLFSVAEAIETSFRMMKLLEFEEEEEIFAAIDIDNDDNYDNTDVFCEEDDTEENYDFCPSCQWNPIVHLLQQCGHMICINCVKKIALNYVDVECQNHKVDNVSMLMRIKIARLPIVCKNN